jgi:arsenate reductase
MGGDRRPKPPVAHAATAAAKNQTQIPSKTKKRVLFVCIGNACRSQMAEAFARAYGADTLTARSAGLAPALGLPPLTRQTLSEKKISCEGQFPKPVESFAIEKFDVVVNMSGERLPPSLMASRSVEWKVRDPIGESEDVYREVAAQIEALVMRLILELRGS